MTLVVLWTDIMVWILVLALLAWGWTLSRSPQVKKLWHTIFRSGIAMASAIILLFYLFFTLFDSLHLRFSVPSTQSTGQTVEYDGEIVSLLDLLFAHSIENTERTYSAPFATHEYASSIVVDEQGVTKQVYLPLKHVSSGDDILKKSLFALMTGLLISVLLIILHLFWRKREGVRDELRKIWKGRTDLPWRTAYLTLTLLVMTFVWFYMLSFDYHVLGTDKVGGDVLYQSFKSIRTGV